jgi:hypothetical protein
LKRGPPALKGCFNRMPRERFAQRRGCALIKQDLRF